MKHLSQVHQLKTSLPAEKEEGQKGMCNPARLQELGPGYTNFLVPGYCPGSCMGPYEPHMGPYAPGPPISRQLLAGGLLKWVTFVCKTGIWETLRLHFGTLSDHFSHPGVHRDTQWTP